MCIRDSARSGRNTTEDHLIWDLAEFIFKRKFCDYKETMHHVFAAIGELYSGDSVVSTILNSESDSDSVAY